MTFTVTHRALGEPEQAAQTAPTQTGPAAQTRYDGDDTFTLHDSGALIVTRRSGEEIVYAPGTWLAVHKASDGSAAPGTYL